MRLWWFFITVVLLVACNTVDQQSESSLSTPTVESIPEPTATPTLTATVVPTNTPVPTETAEPTPTVPPTPTITPTATKRSFEQQQSEQLEVVFRTFFSLTATGELLEESVSANALVNPLDSLGQNVLIESFLEQLENAFRLEAPLVVVEEEWNLASDLFVRLESLYTSWVSEEVNSEDVLEALTPLQNEIALLPAQVRESVEAEYDMAPGAYQEIRGRAATEVAALRDGKTDETPVESTTPDGIPADVYALSIGDCFYINFDQNEVSQVLLVSCDDPHIAEVFALIDYPADEDETWIGQEAIDGFSDEECVNAFEPYVGLSYAESIYYISYLQPTETTWSNGDREVVCLIVEANNGEIVGSARNSRE